MTTRRDPKADEVFLEVALREVLEGRPAPDFRQVLKADAGRRAAAAALIDAASFESRRTFRGPLLLAASLLLVGAAVTVAVVVASRDRRERAEPPFWVASSADAEHDAGPSGSRPASTADHLHELLDRFHAVMPRQPVALRDLTVRRRTAPMAIPVLRQIDDFLGQHLDEPGFASIRREFRIYALALGDEQTTDRLAELAKTDPVAADLQSAAAGLIRATDDGERREALGAFGRALNVPCDAATSAVRTLEFAGDLTAAEAGELARLAVDPKIRSSLTALQEWARKDPRKRLGQPLVLEGKLASGEGFSTESMRGRIVVVHFWGSWLAHCDRALSELFRVRARFLDHGVSVVGVSCDRDPVAFTEFLRQHPEISWPQMFDAEHAGWHRLATSLGVSSIPRVFLIDRDGILRSVDAQEDLLAEVRRLVDE